MLEISTVLYMPPTLSNVKKVLLEKTTLKIRSIEKLGKVIFEIDGSEQEIYDLKWLLESIRPIGIIFEYKKMGFFRKMIQRTDIFFKSL